MSQTNLLLAQEDLLLLRQLVEPLKVVAVLSDERSTVEQLADVGHSRTLDKLVDVSAEFALRLVPARRRLSASS